jgi:hypothetical protein
MEKYPILLSQEQANYIINLLNCEVNKSKSIACDIYEQFNVHLSKEDVIPILLESE